MEIYVPSGITEQEAFSRTTHIAIAAHQDDIEIMAYHGILECFGSADKWFAGVVVTNGSGSPRSGLYETCSDEEMMKIRREEQKKAAYIGDYSVQMMLDLPSSVVKDPLDLTVADSIKEIITRCRPRVIYTHNLADKHDTHVAVAVKTIEALRELDAAYLPQKVYGCEVWRGLDWMNDSDKAKLDVAGRQSLENALLGVFDSQICGGKRYDLAAMGRRLANATFLESHSVDDTSALIYAMDLTPLITDKKRPICEFVARHIDHFKADVEGRVKKCCGGKQ